MEDDLLLGGIISFQSFPSLPDVKTFRSSLTQKLVDAPEAPGKSRTSVDKIKGRILIANESIKSGEIIFFERPALRVIPYVRGELAWSIEHLNLSGRELSTSEKGTLNEIHHYPSIYGTKSDHRKARLALYDEVLTVLILHYKELNEETKTFLDTLFVPNIETYERFSPIIKELDDEILDEILDEMIVDDDEELKMRIKRAVYAMSINGFEAGGKAIAVFEWMCLASHSCAPNAVWTWSPELDAMVLVATKNLDEGEEMEVSYLTDEDLICPSAIRRDSLRAYYCFDCQCLRCKAEADIEMARHTRDRSSCGPSEDETRVCISCGTCSRPFPVHSSLFEEAEDDRTRGAITSQSDIAVIPPCPCCCAPLAPMKGLRPSLVMSWVNILEHPGWITTEIFVEHLLEKIQRLVVISDLQKIHFLSSCFRELEALMLFNIGLIQTANDKEAQKEVGIKAARLMEQAVSILIRMYGKQAVNWLESSHLVPLMFMYEMGGEYSNAEQVSRLIWDVLTRNGVASEMMLMLLHDRATRWQDETLQPSRAFSKRQSSLTLCAERARVMGCGLVGMWGMD